MPKVDPITVEIVKGALIYASEEMGISLRNAAYSPNIRERMDHSCAIFDHERRMIAQAEHIPVHLGSMAWAVREGLRLFRGELDDGDMVILNDPYISGTHLPDITLISPVFHKDEVVGYVANKAHHSDVGGKAPGSMAGDATEIYQEGIVIPPVKFVEGGEVIHDVARIIMSNVRTPDVRMGDLRAQMAGNIMGRRRILEMVERYGLATFRKACEEVLNYSERMMRREISKIPEGRYEAEDYLENTGVSDQPVKLRVAVTVEDDHIKIDYTGTDPQAEGPVNAVWGVTLSGVYYTLRCVTDPSIPMNDGCHRPVKVYAPQGTVLNPTPPAPVAGGNVETSQRNVDVLLKAFARAIPHKVCAACQGTMNNVSMGGLDPRTGRQWSFYETIAGGMGGRPTMDGIDGIHTHMTNTMNTPIEVAEKEFPMLFLKYGLRRDSGGAGRWRGGNGVERSWMLLSPSATLSILAERTRIPPWGLYGGKSGAFGEYSIRRRDGTVVRLRSKCTVKMNKGDVLIVKTPGGGGYGDPLDRNPDLVLDDVVEGKVSLKSAYEEYGVVINRDAMRVDATATRKRRQGIRSSAGFLKKEAIGREGS
ncbi:MAG: hydantoinase B/oxoprolinase family protein [Candidatus Bathyarchaeia archaeon]